MAIPVFHTTYASKRPPAIHTTVERLGTRPTYPEIYTGSSAVSGVLDVRQVGGQHSGARQHSDV
jgi:hypothetical protein